MKSFSQFLNESYLEERDMKKRKPGGATPEEVQAGIDARKADEAARKAQRGPTGAAARQDLKFKRSTVASPTTTPTSGPTGTPPKGPVRPSIGNVSGPASSPKPPKGPVRPSIGNVSGPASSRKPPKGPVRPSIGNVSGPASSPKPPKGPVRPSIGNVSGPASSRKPPKGPVRPSIGNVSGPASSRTRPAGGNPPTGAPPSGTSSAAKETQKAVTKTAGKGILKTLGRVAGPAAAALDVADERSKGSGWARSLAKGAVVAAGGALGGAGGSVAGPVGTLAGATGGSMAASKAFDVVAGKNAKERAADRMANRQKQAGTAVKGIGGKTTFSQTKPGGPAFMSTGSGAQRKTVQLAKTSVVQRGGQSVAGYAAKKGNQIVYKAPPAPGTGSKNKLENIGRFFAPGAYKANDAKLAAKKLATARASDAARNTKLGVKSKPAG